MVLFVMVTAAEAVTSTRVPLPLRFRPEYVPPEVMVMALADDAARTNAKTIFADFIFNGRSCWGQGTADAGAGFSRNGVLERPVAVPGSLACTAQPTLDLSTIHTEPRPCAAESKGSARFVSRSAQAKSRNKPPLDKSVPQD